MSNETQQYPLPLKINNTIGNKNSSLSSNTSNYLNPVNTTQNFTDLKSFYSNGSVRN